MRLISTAALFLMGATTALAGTLALFNPSFETAPAGGALALGGLGAQGDVPGWGTFGSLPSEDWPTAAMLPSGIPDGVQVLLSYENGGADQNTPYTFAAGNTYTYSVYVGLEAGSVRLPWELLIYGSGSSLVAFTLGDPATLIDGGWVLSTVSFTPAVGDPHLGQTFYLQFGTGNAPGSVGTDHLFFDDVSADAIPFGDSPTPEPATLFPAGLAAWFMLRKWRRRQHR